MRKSDFVKLWNASDLQTEAVVDEGTMGRLSFLTAELMCCVISGSTPAKIGRQSCKGPHGCVADVPQPFVPLSLCPQPVSAAPRSGTLPERAWGSAPRTGTPRDFRQNRRDPAARKADLFKLSSYWVVKADVDMILRDIRLFGF